MKLRILLPACIVLVFFFVFKSCKSLEDENEQLAKQYCSSCHLFPEAALLDKTTWQKNILPVMGSKLGIRYFRDSPYQVNDYLNNKNKSYSPNALTLDNWKKIIAYYEKNAPNEMPPQKRSPIKNFTDRFKIKKVLEDTISPAVTYIKIDEGNKWIYTGNAIDSSLNIYNEKLQALSRNNVHSVVVDMDFNTSLQQSGERSGVFANIGIMNPNDLRRGTADTFYINKEGSLAYAKQILDGMPRPVQIAKADFDKDGLQDYLICGFGNTTGALYWMKNKGNQQFEQNMIRPLPGAIKTYIDDYNNDGLPDLMTLMAQGQEGVYLFTNKGDGSFDTKAILQFPPVYGSSYFELDDFNNDGYKDILYTCGDNADYSSHVLKDYHGVYIFLNDGKNNFTQKYFFPVHGCYKAIAKDFDKDGDLDIATISFFPDRKNQPQESFVYLENKGSSFFNRGFQFEPYTIHEFNEGNWLTMDAGDVDGDGDDDIVLGNFNLPGKEMQRSQHNLKKPLFLLLLNKTK